MLRPRWHDVLIVLAIVGLLLAGVWALWWDDIRVKVFGAGSGSQTPAVPTSPGPAPST